MRRTCVKTFWLISRYRTGGMEAMRTTLATGEEALPAFSSEVEAHMFLGLGTFEGDWRPRETSAGELIPMLHCLCAGVDRIVLDPLPHASSSLSDFVSMGRGAFIEFASGQGRAAPPAPISSPDLAGCGTSERAHANAHAKNGSTLRSTLRLGEYAPDGRLSDATARTAALERR